MVALFPKGKSKFVSREEWMEAGHKTNKTKTTKQNRQQISTVEEDRKNILGKEIST